MRVTNAVVAVVLGIGMMGLIGCGANDVTDSSQIVFPDSNVSYHASVEPYMALSCAVPGCHDGPGAPLGVDLSSWYGIRAPNVVAPGDTNSPLVLVMYAKVAHSSPIKANENQRHGIRQWVLEGAQNN